jgi:hypothetical protein
MLKKFYVAIAAACLCFSALAETVATPPPITLIRPERNPSADALNYKPVNLPGPCPRLPASSAYGSVPRRVTPAKALADVDTYFTALRWCYSGYFDFGGDVIFNGAKERIKKTLHSEPSSAFMHSEEFSRLIADNISFITDVHLSIGTHNFGVDRVVCLNEDLSFTQENEAYYLVDAKRSRIISVDGAPPATRIKPSISVSGELVYRLVFYGLRNSPAFSQSDHFAEARLRLAVPGGGEIERLARMPEIKPYYAVPQAEWRGLSSSIFSETTMNGIPMLKLRRVFPLTERDTKALRAFSARGASLKAEKAFVMDLRGNPGGSDAWGSLFLKGLLGQEVGPMSSWMDRRSLAAEAFVKPTIASSYHGGIGGKLINQWYNRGRFTISAKRGSNWKVSALTSPTLEQEKCPLVFVLSDRNVASSGEGLLGSFRMLPTIIQIGLPSVGCVNYGNVMDYVLPNTRILVRIPMSRGITKANIRETVGYEPDIWVPADQAEERTAAFIKRYGLEAIQKAIRISP